MGRWKRVVSLTAMFAAMGLIAMAGQAQRGEGRGARAGRGQRLSPEEQAKVDKIVAAVLPKALAKELSIDEAKAKKVVDAYVAARQAAMKAAREAQGDQEAMRAAFTKMREDTQKVLTDNLTEEQARTARRLISSLETSIRALAGAKVEQAKIEKAMPVLVQYAKDTAGLFGRRGGGDQTSREERMEKMRKAREETAKKLEPIVGEEGAAAWQRRGSRMFGGMRGGQRGGQRGGGAAGGERRQRGGGGDAPVAP